MNILTNQKIYQTKDYDQFLLLELNRTIKHNRHLEKIILSNNKLHLNPIIVSPDMEIMDGQHRWDIAKKNNLHLFFIIDESAHVHDIIDFNTPRRNWTDRHYLEHFSKDNREAYVFMKECCEKYGISITLFMRNFVKAKSNISATKNLQSGNITLKYKKDFIHETLENYKEVIKLIVDYLKYYSLRECHKIEILKCIIHPGYKQEIFLKGIKSKPDLLFKLHEFGTSKAIKEYIIMIYNAGHKNKTRFVF